MPPRTDRSVAEAQAAVSSLSGGRWNLSVKDCGGKGACLYNSVAALGKDAGQLRKDVAQAWVQVSNKELVERAFTWALFAQTQRTADVRQAKKGFEDLIQHGTLDKSFLQLVRLDDTEEAHGGVNLRGGLIDGRAASMWLSSAALDGFRDILRGVKETRMGNADDLHLMGELFDMGFFVFTNKPSRNGQFIQGGPDSFSVPHKSYVLIYNRDNLHFKRTILTRAGEPADSGKSWFRLEELPGFLKQILSDAQTHQSPSQRLSRSHSSRKCRLSRSRSRSPAPRH